MPARLVAALLALVAGGALPAAAQQPQRPPACNTPEHRQFDFWIGTWDVFNPRGQQVGMNVITMDLNGCVLREAWQSLGSAHRGNSYNIYDRTTGQWHQTWVDNSGLLLQLDGGLEDASMVLSGTTLGRNGAETLNRITWTPMDDGSVRQHWETSTDGGQSWSTAFDGRYVRRD